MTITTTSYHKRLNILSIYGLQRWRERYAIIYICKIVMQLVPNPKTEMRYNPRAKIKVTPKQNSSASPTWIKSFRNWSFFLIGPQLYNSIPAKEKQKLKLKQYPCWKRKTEVKKFLKKVDEYLRTIPDALGTSQNSILQQK